MGKIDGREKELEDSFNKASEEIFKSEVRYANLKTSDLIELKNALSNIHNIITMKVTRAFIDNLHSDKFISEEQAVRMKEVVNGTSANANGYDVCHDELTKLGEVKKFVDGDKKILAEVKCNIPVKGDEFGAKQKKGIENDINGLLGSEFSSEERTQSNEITRKSSFDTKEYYKFMVFLSYKNKEGKSVVKSVEKLKNNLEEGKYKEKLDYYERIRPSEIKKDKVYIVFVEI